MNWPLPSKSLVGMVHLGALPGSPGHARSIRDLARAAVAEARVLAEEGFDAIMLENMHDRPYVNAPHPPETVASFTRIAGAVRDALPDVRLGFQVLSLGHIEALAIAHAVGGDFIRVENFAFAHIGDEGLMPDATAGPLLRARRTLGAASIALLCDIKKKHASHAMTADLSLADTAKATEFLGADAVVITGAFTGEPTSPDDVIEAKRACGIRVVVGSGATPDDAPDLLRHADALIVGSFIKRGGVWSNPVDRRRCRVLRRACPSPRRAQMRGE